MRETSEAPGPLEEAAALMANGNAREAATLLRALIDSGRGGMLARIELSRALIAAGDIGDALAEAREAVLLNHSAAPAALALGQALMAAGLPPAALGEFQRALRLDENLIIAHYHMGCAWLEAGEPERALESFANVPEDVAPPEMVAKIAEARAMPAAQRSDPRYLRHLFDQFSGDYDTRMLGALRYSGHMILRELANLVMGIPRHDLSILDLGCGTGLGGVAFWDLAARMDGVDLSPQMVARARDRGLYDHLVTADIETVLNEGGADYDLLIASDTLVYLGDLTNVFAGAARRLKPDGFFLFTTEKKPGDGYELGPKRRWRHSERYIREKAESTGLEIAGLVACTPRFEAGKPVPGFAVALTRPGLAE